MAGCGTRGGGGAEGVDQGAGEDFGLVVAAGAAASPMERDGDDQVNVREVRSGGEAAARPAARSPWYFKARGMDRYAPL